MPQQQQRQQLHICFRCVCVSVCSRNRKRQHTIEGPVHGRAAATAATCNKLCKQTYFACMLLCHSLCICVCVYVCDCRPSNAINWFSVSATADTVSWRQANAFSTHTTAATMHVAATSRSCWSFNFPVYPFCVAWVAYTSHQWQPNKQTSDCRNIHKGWLPCGNKVHAATFVTILAQIKLLKFNCCDSCW